MNNVLIDWCSFTLRNIEYYDVYNLLGLDGSSFIETKFGRYGYKKHTNFDGINVLWDGIDENSGVLVEMSGQGCRTFETYGNGDFMSLFKLLQDDDDLHVNFTRIDIAYDDFDNTLPLDKLLTDYLHDNFVSRCQNSELVLSKGNTHGTTIQHGSNQSNVVVRIYDKKAERKRTDIDYWVRCELQLRKENANGVVNLLLFDRDIREVYFSVLNNYLRYIQPSDVVNDRELPMTDYWAKFVETWKVNSVFVQPGTQYNICNLNHTVVNMYGNATLTYIECVGMDRFIEDLRKNAVKRPRAAKYEKIKRDYEKEFGKLEGLPPAAERKDDKSDDD